MGTKTIGLRDDVYERLRARKRDDESFTDLVDRLIDESTADWRETFGTLSTEEGEKLEAATERSRELSGRGSADRQREAIEALVDQTTDSDDDDN